MNLRFNSGRLNIFPFLSAFLRFFRTNISNSCHLFDVALRLHCGYADKFLTNDAKMKVLTTRRARAAAQARAALLGLALACIALPSQSEALYNLSQLVELALAQNPSMAASRAQVQGAEAGVTTAGARPNPELEVMTGSNRARLPGTVPGDSHSVSLTQRLDLPPVRNARINAATAQLNAEQAQLRAAERELVRNVKLRYYELVRRHAELDAAESDLVTSAQIHERVSVRVKSGEAPRYDIIKADAELLSAQKQVQAARLRLSQAQAQLRQAVGAHLPAQFEVLPPTDSVPDLPPLVQLQRQALQSNPELERDRALAKRARSQLALERSARLPTLALRAGIDQDPEVRSQRLGVVVSIPIWDRRAGPIGEASAQLARAQAEQELRQLNLQQSLEAAYHQVDISRNQVTALESGIVRQAEAALRIAEAAYRFGERGILDYLDAQRVYRNARNELIAARYELRAALIEIEKLHSQ